MEDGELAKQHCFINYLCHDVQTRFKEQWNFGSVDPTRPQCKPKRNVFGFRDFQT